MFGRRSSSTPRQDGGTGLGAGWWVAAGFMAVVIVALVGVLIVIGTRDTTAVAGGPATAPTTAPGAVSAVPAPPGPGDTTPAAPAADGRPAGCATTGTDQTIPGDTPKGVTWTLNKGMALPSSAADGPALRGDAGVGYCYSRTPVGAVIAASNIGRGTGTGQELQDAQFKYSIVPSDLASQAAAVPIAADDPAATSGVQLAGFRVISYTQDSASVALALSTTSRPGTFLVGTLAMQWFEGDWRAVMQPGPSVLSTTTTTSSLDGYVPWSGVS